METRAAKRRANAANLPNLQTQPLKKKRVVLGELPNIPNLTVPQKPKCLKKVTATKKKTLSSSSDSSVDATIKGLDDDNVIDANSTTHNTKCNDDRQNGDPFVHDIYSYLRAMEVIFWINIVPFLFEFEPILIRLLFVFIRRREREDQCFTTWREFSMM